MPMPAPQTEQQMNMPFAILGVDSGDPTDRQRPMTCRDALNVRGIEPQALRLRGGSRPGLSRWIDEQLPIPS